MAIGVSYRPGYASTSALRVALDGWSAGSPGDVDNLGTVWMLAQGSPQGWHEAPQARLAMSERSGEHGNLDGPAWLGSRVITIEGSALATSINAARHARDILASVCGDPSLGLQTLVVTVPGDPALRASVRRSAETRTAPRGGGSAFDWSMILTAPDPRRYADSASTGQVGLPVPSGSGLVFPLVFPLDFGTAASGGEMTLTNAGTIATWCSFDVLGPVTGPIITVPATGATLAFDPTFAVPAGQTLTIDQDAKTVTLAGVNRRDRLFTAQWFRLDPGDTTVRFLSASGYDAAARLTANWRAAYT